jgi:hypothetical protein
LEAWFSTDVRDKSGMSFFVGLFNFGDASGNQTVTATLPVKCAGVRAVDDLWGDVVGGDRIGTAGAGEVESNNGVGEGAANTVSRQLGPHASALLHVKC